MPDEVIYIHTIELPGRTPIEFQHLPKLLAEALHQAPFERTAAAVSFEAELIDEILAGKLAARNPFTLAKYPTDIDDFIKHSVILPSELAPVLAERSIRLVLTGLDGSASPSRQTLAEPDQLLKRSALVDRYEREWPTIDRDLRDAATNGLHAAAHGGRRGYWYEEAAKGWATARHKLRQRQRQASAAPSTGHRWPGMGD